MKKAVMNKNVNYGKAKYSKGQEISESDLGFKELVQAGHAEAMKVEMKIEAPKEMGNGEAVLPVAEKPKAKRK